MGAPITHVPYILHPGTPHMKQTQAPDPHLCECSFCLLQVLWVNFGPGYGYSQLRNLKAGSQKAGRKGNPDARPRQRKRQGSMTPFKDHPFRKQYKSALALQCTPSSMAPVAMALESSFWGAWRNCAFSSQAVWFRHRVPSCTADCKTRKGG